MDVKKIVWVEQVLGVKISDMQLQEHQAPVDDPLDLKNRLATAGRQFNDLKAEGDPALPELLKAMAAAFDAVKNKLPTAGDLMNTLEATLARAMQAAQHRKLSQEFAGKVDYAKLLLRWRQAQVTVATNMQQLITQLRSHPGVLSDEDPEELLDLIDDIPDLMPQFGSALDDVLDEAGKPGADVQSLREDALEILADYRQEVLAVVEMKELEEMAAKSGIGSFTMFSEFQAAFADLQKELSK